MEGTFASQLGVAECEAELRAAGFVSADEWTATSKKSSGGDDD